MLCQLINNNQKIEESSTLSKHVLPKMFCKRGEEGSNRDMFGQSSLMERREENEVWDRRHPRRSAVGKRGIPNPHAMDNLPYPQTKIF